MGSRVDWKQRAIEQWTADPCGPEVEGIEALMAGRREYAPWMAEQLDYGGSSGLEVLDVGCGQGIDVCEFALAGARVTGIDLTPRHVELAHHHVADLGVEAAIVEGDAEKLPFPDASFDRVTSNGVLHHTPNIEAALSEIRRVLRPGGTTSIVLYNRNSWHYWIKQVLWYGVLHGWIVSERGMGGVLSRNVETSSVEARPLVHVYSRRQLSAMLRRTRFAQPSTWVSPFKPDETPFTVWLPSGLQLGHGWYVVGHGRRP
jgi:ubiquinone/menaquinone biosynthesis C-methylase UbiE